MTTWRAELNELLLKHKVLFFRDQDITGFPSMLRSLAGLAIWRITRWPPAPRASRGSSRSGRSPESPPERYENAWHNDATWRECPPMGAVLRCVECPPVGGDTMWANMELAFERLPERVKEDIIDLRARHSMEASFMAAKPIDERLAMKERFPDPEHPVVRTHPVTGNKSLFVNAFATHFTNYHTAKRVRYGQDHTQGTGELLRYLISQAHIPEYQVRWRWTPNSIAMWDNRCTQHYAVMDYPPCIRRMNRATIIGDRPF